MLDLKSKSSWLANLFLVGTAVLIALASGEIVLRSLGFENEKPPLGPKENWVLVPERVWTEYHPVLGWYHQKNKAALLRTGDFEVEIHTNSQGFRGLREYALEKPWGVVRLLALGDSFSFGFGVRDEEVWTAELEAKSPRWEVINLSVPGYGLDQMLVSYRMIGKDWGADVVLISVFQENFWRSMRSFADSGHAKPYFSLSEKKELVLHNVPVPEPYSLKTNQFPPLIQQGALEQLLEKSLSYRATRKALMRLGKNLGILDPDLTTEWILGKAILRDLVGEIREAGSQPVLLIIPSEYEAQQIKLTSLAKSLHRFAREHRVELIDPTSSFYRAIREKTLYHFYLKGDRHWTAEAHRLVANLIQDFLEKQGFA